MPRMQEARPIIMETLADSSGMQAIFRDKINEKKISLKLPSPRGNYHSNNSGVGGNFSKTA